MIESRERHVEKAPPRNAQTRFVIAVDSAGAYDYVGWVRHEDTGQAWAYQGVYDLLSIIDDILSTQTSLQASHRARCWKGLHKDRYRREPLEEDARRTVGEEATFLLHIQCRQNVSWQGTIAWQEIQRAMHFRSTLELIQLMELVVRATSVDGWMECEKTQQ